MVAATARAERRLAAILAADVVGYSRLVEADEAGTLAAIKELRREVVDPLLAEHRGRIVKLMGDGLIAEFGSVVDAVACVVAMQKGVAARQVGMPAERRIVFRAGVNLGDVVVEGDGEDLLGDGVNVAARLEQLCEPGGVLVSGTAYDHLRGKLDGAPLEFVGERHLKNIERPVRTYRVRLDGVQAAAAPPRPRRLGRMLPAAALLLLTLVLAAGAGAWWWLLPGEPGLAGRPSIAVLPFGNLSGDPEQDYLADGLAEDVITELARDKNLLVIARNSTFTYKGKPVDVRRVGSDLGARYVLEGSVRRSGNNLRVNAQLVDSRTGEHVWAERYDRPVSEVLQVQDDIVRNVGGRVTNEILQAEWHAARRRPVGNFDAYQLALKGQALKHEFTPASYREAKEALARALELDPDLALAHALLAYMDVVDITNAVLGEVTPDQLDDRIDKLRHAIDLDPQLPLAWQALGFALVTKGDVEGALAAGRRSVELGPGDADNHILLNYTEASAGDFEAAIERGLLAMRMNPRSQIYYPENMARAYFGAGRYAEAVPYASDCVTRQKDYGACYAWLAASQVALGRLDEARGTVGRLKTNSPAFTLAVAEYSGFPRRPDRTRAFLDNLRAAGLE